MIRSIHKTYPCAILLVLTIVACIIASPTACALKTDSDKPMNISAHSLDILYEDRKSILTGDALITQGTTKLSGEKIIIYYDKNNKFEKMFAYGNKNTQAQYNTILDKNYSLFSSTADTIQYFNKNKLAKFLGDAHANDGTNNFAGPELEYWSERGEVLTKGNKAQKIQITIMPDSLKHHEK